MKIAVCLVSGGMDSCVCAAIAHNQGYQLAFLHANYGQRTEAKELQAFHALADHYQAAHRLVIDMTCFNQIGGSSLLSQSQDNIPTAPITAAAPSTHIPSTYVPFRNGLLLSIATSWAEVLGAEALYFGAVEQDSSGYPDCRISFIRAFESAINQGTKPSTHITIESPLVSLSKTQIVQKAQSLNAPLHLTWSCYQDNTLSCGQCESCQLRLKGFSGAGLKDPIAYHVLNI